MIADHLSRMEKPTEEERGTGIVEIFHDEQLFQVLVQTPWYVDIVNLFGLWNHTTRIQLPAEKKVEN